jgi:serine/threonine protein kinase
MNIIIHPEYTYLNDFILNLPSFFNKSGNLIYKSRNELKDFNAERGKVVVKSFKVPHLINKIAYTFFRPSKAKRSYNYALILTKDGIETPNPIAYMEEKKNGLLNRSYYISNYVNYPGLLRELAYHPLEEVKELVKAFALFTASLHEKEVLHLDYSPGNIMYEKRKDQYYFCLVDINRMKFGKIDMKNGCFNLRRLWGSDETIAYLAKEYALARGFSSEDCVALVLKYHHKFWEKAVKRNPKARPYWNV